MELEENTSPNAFIEKLDKRQIPACNILGVKIAAIDMPWLLNYTREHIKELSGNYLCVANVHTTITAYQDLEYCAIQNGGIMAIPDGGPLASLGRKRGFREMKRITGPSYMEEILQMSVQNGYRHFFYGSTEDTLLKLSKVLQKRYPGLAVVGMYSPPFREVSNEEDADIIRQINETHPDFLWVGLGAPKQERWMAKHQGKVEGLMVGVGAGFDFLAGNIKRAPGWMQRNNLEWLYRLMQDPGRLLKRYWTTNWKFIWLAYVMGR